MDLSNHSKPLILLVESDALQRDLMTLALERSQMECLPARSLTEARQILSGCTPALALVDLYLDSENGLDLAAVMKKSNRLGDVKVIVFSSYGYPDVIRQAVQAGACDFLVKPLEMNLLVERIQRALGERVSVSALPA